MQKNIEPELTTAEFIDVARIAKMLDGADLVVKTLGPEDTGPGRNWARKEIRNGSSVARVDDWIRTSVDLFTRQVPFSYEPHRQVSGNVVIRTLSDPYLEPSVFEADSATSRIFLCTLGKTRRASKVSPNFAKPN